MNTDGNLDAIGRELAAAESETNLFFGLSRRKFTDKEISEIAAYVSEAVTKCLTDLPAAPTEDK